MPADRRRGLSARMRLTLSYAASFGMAGALLVAAAWSVQLVRNFVPALNQLLHTALPWQLRGFLADYIVPGSIGIVVVLLAIGFVWGWFIAGRMLAPLGRISEVAQRAARGDLSQRVALEGRADEFRDLADVFDLMLERLEAHVTEQQRFAANASHELRTPLAIMRTQLEVARADPHRDVDALLDRLVQVNARAIELTEALLLLARADGQSFARERLDLSLLADEAVETLLPVAERRGIRIWTRSEPAPMIGSPALLQQLVSNLLHNAIVHNLPAGSGAGGAIDVKVTAESESTVMLTVANTGAHVPAALLTTLTEPFQRGAARTRSGDTGPVTAELAGGSRGLGLGLAIVQSITRAHQGDLRLSARPEGGLMVEVRFPSLGVRRQPSDA